MSFLTLFDISTPSTLCPDYRHRSACLVPSQLYARPQIPDPAPHYSLYIYCLLYAPRSIVLISSHPTSIFRFAASHSSPLLTPHFLQIPRLLRFTPYLCTPLTSHSIPLSITLFQVLYIFTAVCSLPEMEIETF